MNFVWRRLNCYVPSGIWHTASLVLQHYKGRMKVPTTDKHCGSLEVRDYVGHASAGLVQCLKPQSGFVQQKKKHWCSERLCNFLRIRRSDMSNQMKVMHFPSQNVNPPNYSPCLSVCSAGDLDLIPGSGRSPGGGHGNPLQYSCLEKPLGQRSLAGSKVGQRVRLNWVTKHTNCVGWVNTKTVSSSGWLYNLYSMYNTDRISDNQIWQMLLPLSVSHPHDWDAVGLTQRILRWEPGHLV